MKFHTSVQDMRLRLPFLTPLAQTWFYMCHADATFFLLDGVGRIKVESSRQGGLNTDSRNLTLKKRNKNRIKVKRSILI
jgi:hypothetical protein